MEPALWSGPVLLTAALIARSAGPRRALPRWFLAARAAFLAGVVGVWIVVAARLSPSSFTPAWGYATSFALALVGLAAGIVLECRELMRRPA